MIYGLYLAYTKWEVLPVEECADPTVPRYPASVARVRAYSNKRDQIEAYANTMCPASQTFEAETKEEFLTPKSQSLKRILRTRRGSLKTLTRTCNYGRQHFSFCNCFWFAYCWSDYWNCGYGNKPKGLF